MNSFGIFFLLFLCWLFSASTGGWFHQSRKKLSKRVRSLHRYHDFCATNFFTFLALSYSNPIHFALAANSTCDVTLIIINGCKNPSSGPVFLGPAPIFVHLCPEQRSVPLLSPHLRHHQPRPLRQVLFHAFEDYLILTFLVAWLSIATS